MRDIPTLELVQVDLAETRRELARSQSLSLKYAASLRSAVRSAELARECLAILVHRSGIAGTELTEVEKKAAWDATWLRVRLDILEHDGEDEHLGTSVRLTLVPVTDDERDANVAKLKTQNTETGANKIRLYEA